MTIKLYKLFSYEEIYLGIKNSYQGDRSKNKIKKALKYSVLRQNVMFVITYIILSSSFSTYLIIKPTIATLTGVFFIIYIITFVISLFYSTLFLSNAMDLNIFAPLKALPIRQWKVINALLYSWLVYNGFAILVLSFPVAIAAFYVFRSIILLVTALVWGVMIIFFGFSWGTMLSFYISSKTIKGKSKRSSLKQALRSIVMIVVILFWYFIFYSSEHLSHSFTAFATNYANYWYVFPFSGAYAVSYSITMLSISVLLTVGYTASFVLVFIYATKKLATYMDQSFYAKATTPQQQKHSTGSYLSPVLGYLIRTTHFISRKPQALTSFIIPIVMFIPILLNYSQFSGSTAIGASISILLSAVVMIPITSLSLLILEGRAYWILKTLPLTRAKLAYMKSVGEFIIYTIIFVIISVIIKITLHVSVVNTLIILAILLIASFNILLFSNTFLFSRIKPDTYIITSSTVGGNIIGALLILFSVIFVYGPYGLAMMIKTVSHISTSLFSLTLLGIYVGITGTILSYLFTR